MYSQLLAPAFNSFSSYMQFSMPFFMESLVLLSLLPPQVMRGVHFQAFLILIMNNMMTHVLAQHMNMINRLDLG
jgi:hypothetical protein